MSEYIEIEAEESDDGSRLFISTNLQLAEGDIEDYYSREAMEEGSPVAQALSMIDGITHLRILESDLIITREPEYEWYSIAEAISSALKAFFL